MCCHARVCPHAAAAQVRRWLSEVSGVDPRLAGRFACVDITSLLPAGGDGGLHSFLGLDDDGGSDVRMAEAGSAAVSYEPIAVEHCHHVRAAAAAARAGAVRGGVFVRRSTAAATRGDVCVCARAGVRAAAAQRAGVDVRVLGGFAPVRGPGGGRAGTRACGARGGAARERGRRPRRPRRRVQNCSLMVHEATFGDGQAADALAKVCVREAVPPLACARRRL